MINIQFKEYFCSYRSCYEVSMLNSIERSFAFITHFRLTKHASNVYLFMYVYYVSVFIVVVAASSLAARKISIRPAATHFISIIMKTKVKTKRRKQINTKP